MDVLLLALAWTALVLAPGYGLVRLLAPVAGRLRALALGPAVTLGATAFVSTTATAAGVTMGRPLAVGVAVVGPLLVVLAERRSGPAALGRLSVRTAWGQERLAVVGATVLCLGIWAAGVVDVAHPPYGDAINHASFVARILATGGVDPAQVVLADVPSQMAGAAYYPLTLHVLMAGMVALTGAPIGTALTVTLALTSAVTLPAGSLLVTRMLLPGRRVARVATPVLAVLPAAFPFGPLLWGGVPLIVAMSLVPGVVEAALTAARWGRVRATGPLVGLAVAGVTATHPSEGPLVAVLVLLNLLWRPPVVAKMRRVDTLRPLMLAAAVAFVLLLPQVTQISQGASERFQVENAGLIHTGAFPAVVTAVLFALSPVPPWALWVAVVLAGVGVAVARRECLGWLIALVASWVLLVLLFATTWGWVEAITSPWYSLPYRFSHNAYLLATPFAALGVDACGRALHRVLARVGDGRSAATAAVLGVLAVLLVVPAIGGTVRGLREVTGDVGVDRHDEAAYRWMAERTGPTQRVLNYHYDGSSWMYPDVGLNPVLGMRLFTWDAPVFASRWALERTADQIGVDPQATRTARELNVRYVFWGGHFWVAGGPLWNSSSGRLMTLERLERAPGLREVFRSGDVRVFEVVGS